MTHGIAVTKSYLLLPPRHTPRTARTEGTERLTGKAGQTSRDHSGQRRVFRHYGHRHVEDVRIPRRQVQRRVIELGRSL